MKSAWYWHKNTFIKQAIRIEEQTKSSNSNNYLLYDKESSHWRKAVSWTIDTPVKFNSYIKKNKIISLCVQLNTTQFQAPQKIRHETWYQILS